MKDDKLILVGGGGHCKSCIDVIEQENKYKIAGIVDVPEKIGCTVLGYKVLASDNELNIISKEYRNFLITLGQLKSPALRIKIFKRLEDLKVNLPIVKSPLSYVSKHTQIGKGTIIMHNAIINADAKIGNNCIINTRALIEHDAQIGNHCHISTGSIVNGGVKVGGRTFYGSGAVSRQYIEIPENSFIKANSIVK